MAINKNILIFILIILALLLLYKLLKSSILIIKKDYNAVIQRNNKFYKILTPGIHILIPFIDKVARVFYTKEQILDMPQRSFSSKENLNYAVNVEAHYIIEDAKAFVYANANTQTELEDFVIKLTDDTLESIYYENQETLLEKANEILSFQLIQHGNTLNGIKINKVFITDITII